MYDVLPALSATSSRVGDFCLRPIKEVDILQIGQIDSLSFHDHNHGRDVARTLGDTKYIHIAAEHRGILAGYLVAYKTRKDRWMLITVAVRPMFRKQGVGTKLVRALLTDAIGSHGVDQVYTAVRLSDRITWTFLRAIGFICSHCREIDKQDYLGFTFRKGWPIEP